MKGAESSDSGIKERVLIVDDCSSDNSREILYKKKNKIYKKQSKYRLRSFNYKRNKIYF